MTGIEWPVALSDYDALAEDGDPIADVRETSQRRQEARHHGLSDDIRLVVMAKPITIAGEEIRFFGVNETGYAGRTNIWPFKDDEVHDTYRYDESGHGGTLGEWTYEKDQHEETFESALEWLRQVALEERPLGETE